MIEYHNPEAEVDLEQAGHRVARFEKFVELFVVFDNQKPAI